ncbi:uncharacterized protein METZ01_LOCUS237422, partial [marine metagenome]
KAFGPIVHLRMASALTPLLALTRAPQMAEAYFTTQQCGSEAS